MRQQMNESNHEMVKMLTHQTVTMFNPLIQKTNHSYQQLTQQMGRIADFFSALQVHVQQMPSNQIPQWAIHVEPLIPRVVRGNTGQNGPEVVMVHRNQDVEQVVRNVQQNNFGEHNNITNMVKLILPQNDINVGLHIPNFVLALSEYVLQTELPKSWKTPKFTKFARDTNESTVEHISGYQSEEGDLANNKILKMMYFPNSLTKNAFTGFTTLPSHFIHNWSQLERAFHEQFYMGLSKISLKELVSVR